MAHLDNQGNEGYAPYNPDQQPPDMMVKYFPIFSDGSKGHKQQCYIPTSDWNKESESPLQFARRYFTEKYGAGEDEIVAAKVVEVWT